MPRKSVTKFMKTNGGLVTSMEKCCRNFISAMRSIMTKLK